MRARHYVTVGIVPRSRASVAVLVARLQDDARPERAPSRSSTAAPSW